MRLIAFIAFFLNISTLFAQGGTKSVRMVLDSYQSDLTLYRSYYNRCMPFCKNVRFEDLHAKGDGLEVVKNPEGFFYIKIIGRSSKTRVLEMYDRGGRIGSVRILLNESTPMPKCCFFTMVATAESVSTYKFDSLQICPPGQPLLINNEAQPGLPDYSSGFGYRFQILFFNVEVRRDGLVIYTEQIASNKYSKQFKEYISRNYALAADLECDEKYRSFLTDTLILKSITVKDEQGNMFLLDDCTLAVMPILRLEEYRKEYKWYRGWSPTKNQRTGR